MRRATRKWIAFLMLACAAGSPTVASLPLATALALRLHAIDHEHAVSVVGPEGHRHLVLSHVETEGFGEHGSPPHDEDGESLVAGDHVVELSDDGSASLLSRRSGHDAIAAIGPPLALPSVAPARVARAFAEFRPTRLDPLRIVVLRL